MTHLKLQKSQKLIIPTVAPLRRLNVNVPPGHASPQIQAVYQTSGRNGCKMK